MDLIMQDVTAVGANATNNNVVTGLRYERAPMDCMGQLYVNGSATGLKCELNVGGVAVTELIKVNAQNRLPVIPDDVLVPGFEVPAGALIQVKIQNVTAGSLDASWKVVLSPIADLQNG
jgi:hypothetical protein